MIVSWHELSDVRTPISAQPSEDYHSESVSERKSSKRELLSINVQIFQKGDDYLIVFLRIYHDLVHS